MIALLILFGLLSALFVPNAMQRLAAAQAQAVEAEILAIDDAVERWALEHEDRFPESLEVLVTPDADGHTLLERTSLPMDPWKREYLYAPPDAGQPLPRIWTLGKADLPGGEREDRDVDNLMIRAGERD
jgi:general secretion pathway protein G